MKTITLQIPENLDLNDQQAAILLATKLYEQGKLSLGQAAELAGCGKSDFMELLGQYGVSLFQYNEQELENDIKNAARYHR